MTLIIILSSQNKAAEQILAQWRSNSFGNRESATATGVVPDAVKSFMTGQSPAEEKKHNIQKQTEKAMDTAKHFILGQITGRTGDFPANSNNNKRTEIASSNAAGEQASLSANPNQSMVKIIAAAQALIGGDKKGQAMVLTPGKNGINLAASVSKKQLVPASPLAQTKALEMAQTADKLSSALLSQISPGIITKPETVSTDLVAALNNMAVAGPETSAASLAVKASVQKRSIDTSDNKAKRKRRSLVHKHKALHYAKKHMRRRRELKSRPSENDNPSERSKMNKPIIPAPKLMDKIRDMSMIISTP